MSGKTTESHESLATLYDRYGGRVYGYLLLTLTSPSEAEDALQEVFCRIWEHGLSEQVIANPVGYLFRAAHNEAVTRLRRNWRRWLKLRFLAEQSNALEPREQNSNVEDREAVSHALAQLPLHQKEVVFLKIFEGLTFGEIAKALDISSNTAASRYRYAMTKLETLLREEGFGV